MTHEVDTKVEEIPLLTGKSNIKDKMYTNRKSSRKITKINKGDPMNGFLGPS